MAIVKVRQRKNGILARDPQREAVIKELAAVLESAGYRVRREQLKQGYGWKALSGACTYRQEDLIFVDRRLSQDDQISFLAAKIRALRVAVHKEQLPAVPERLLQQLMQPPAAQS